MPIFSVDKTCILNMILRRRAWFLFFWFWFSLIVRLTIYFYIFHSLLKLTNSRNLISGKWLFVEIKFTFVPECPLLSCVIYASWPLASSSADASDQCLQGHLFLLMACWLWNSLHDGGSLLPMIAATTRFSPILMPSNLTYATII